MYKATIREASKELSAIEKIKIKDVNDALQVVDALAMGEFVVKPVMYAIIDIENDRSNDKNYTKFVFVTEDGTKYITGSESFINNFLGIWQELADANALEEDWAIKIFKKPSKNYSGDFVTCAIA